jgi:hypothetical protein
MQPTLIFSCFLSVPAPVFPTLPCCVEPLFTTLRFPPPKLSAFNWPAAVSFVRNLRPIFKSRLYTIRQLLLFFKSVGS